MCAVQVNRTRYSRFLRDLTCSAGAETLAGCSATYVTGAVGQCKSMAAARCFNEGGAAGGSGGDYNPRRKQ